MTHSEHTAIPEQDLVAIAAAAAFLRLRIRGITRVFGEPTGFTTTSRWVREGRSMQRASHEPREHWGRGKGRRGERETS